MWQLRLYYKGEVRVPQPYTSVQMKKIALSLLFILLCLSAHGASLEFAFQLGEKQNPRLDKLLPNVASRITFNKDSTKLIAHEMGGSIVEWELQNRQKRLIYTVEEDQWSAYTPRLNYLLTPKVNGGISVIDVKNGNEIQIREMGDEMDGQYESGFFSPESYLVALTEGGNEIELWRFEPIELINLKPKSSKTAITSWKISNFKTQLPVRNGAAISDENSYLATAEGTYRDGEGHRTIIEIWDAKTEKQPMRVFNTGEILGVWNLVFSDSGTMLAVDTQLNAKSGICVWDVRTGAQLLNKSGFEAYWTRALAFAPNEKLNSTEYLASGDEKGNLRIWKIPSGGSVVWETYPTGIQTLAFSPNGEYLAVALWDTTIQILRWKRDEK